jgi:hypothetical protein
MNTQYEYLSQVKNNLAANEALIIIDYSQNYTCISQNEVQSAYFSQHQISIFTAYAYVGDGNPVPFLIVNDDIGHSKNQVFHYQKIIINDLKTKFPELERVRIMSDGCAGQFKNKFTLSNILHAAEDFGVIVEWDFFPTSHGKSPADGLGGLFKRSVRHRVLTGKWEVYDAKGFYECAKSFSQDTNLFHVTKEQVKVHDKVLNSRWSNLKTIKGTREFHHFEPSLEPNKISASVSSQKEKLFHFKL